MQIPCDGTRRKRGREVPEPAEPTPALRATPPERGVFPIPSREGCRVSGGVGCPRLGGHRASDKRRFLGRCITRPREGEGQEGEHCVGRGKGEAETRLEPPIIWHELKRLRHAVHFWHIRMHDIPRLSTGHINIPLGLIPARIVKTARVQDPEVRRGGVR